MTVAVQKPYTSCQRFIKVRGYFLDNQSFTIMDRVYEYVRPLAKPKTDKFFVTYNGSGKAEQKIQPPVDTKELTFAVF